MPDNYVISPSAFFEKTIGNLGPSTDYHRQYLFQVILPTIVGISNATLITYFVANTQSPQETTGVINVDWMNSQIKIGGRTTYSEWSVTVRDDATSLAYNYFKSWRRLVYSTSTGQSSIPREYKFPIDMYLLNNKGEQSRGYKIVNAFPTTIGQITLDYSTEGIVTFPITIAYDEFIPLPY